MDISYVLIKPIITEKTSAMTKYQDRVAFRVHPDANKVQIKEAVEAAFSVEVKSVTVVRVRPSDHKRQGRVIGRKAGYKKAYVQLAPGDKDKLEFIQGV